MNNSSKQAEKCISNSLKAAENYDIYIWANKHRKIETKDGWRFFHLNRDPYNYPFLEELYLELSKGNRVVVQKPTQVGLTELAISAAFFFLDTKSEHVLYTLPTSNQLGDFANSRIDPIIENSPYLSNLFSDINNVGLKKAGDHAIYLRGTNSKSGLEEVPVGFLIRDELDRMDRENADLAENRLGASQYKWQFDLSHPTYPGGPIDKLYQGSSRAKWYVKCPECGKVQTIDWEENFYDENNLHCQGCGTSWIKEDLWNYGKWIHDEPENPVRGYQFSKFLSPMTELDEMVQAFEDAKAEGGYKLEQFYQHVLGKPYAAEGTKLDRSDVERFMVGPPMGETIPEISVMGVDVGNWLHYWIQDGEQVVKLGKTESFEMLKQPISEYNVNRIVIDALPEKRKAREFIRSLDIQGWLCMRSDRLQKEKIEKDEIIKVNATEHHDKFMGQFNSESIILPSDLPEEAKEHLTAPVRVTEEDKSGEIKARWEKNVNHYWDAGCYAKEGQDRGDNQAFIL